MKTCSTPTVLISILLLLSGCINPHAVTQRSGAKGWYQVKPSDTLYSIAWRYGLDYRELARWNEINVNSIIHPGQRLLLIDPGAGAPDVASAGSEAQQQSSTPTTSTDQAKVEKTVSSPGVSIDTGKDPSRWRWPTRGELISTFSANALDRRGIDIAGEPGQPILAVADGRVVYSGNGLAGYGNLIIIKHSETYLSAYAYSQERLVKEGMAVAAGKLIARMGKHKTRTARLHFQIRKNGKPVDPLQYLPKR